MSACIPINDAPTNGSGLLWIYTCNINFEAQCIIERDSPQYFIRIYWKYKIKQISFHLCYTILLTHIFVNSQWFFFLISYWEAFIFVLNISVCAITLCRLLTLYNASVTCQVSSYWCFFRISALYTCTHQQTWHVEPIWVLTLAHRLGQWARIRLTLFFTFRVCWEITFIW